MPSSERESAERRPQYCTCTVLCCSISEGHVYTVSCCARTDGCSLIRYTCVSQFCISHRCPAASKIRRQRNAPKPLSAVKRVGNARAKRLGEMLTAATELAEVALSVLRRRLSQAALAVAADLAASTAHASSAGILCHLRARGLLERADVRECGTTVQATTDWLRCDSADECSLRSHVRVTSCKQHALAQAAAAGVRSPNGTAHTPREPGAAEPPHDPLP